MECKLGYGFGRSACIQWLQVVEILLVCTYSSTHSFLFKRLIVSTMHLFTNLSIKLLHSFPHPPSHKPQPCLLCSSILLGFHSPHLRTPHTSLHQFSTSPLHLSFCSVTHMPTASNLPHRFQGPNIPTPDLLVRGSVSPPHLSPPLPLHIILNQAELRMSPGRNALIRSCWSNLCSWA